MVPVHMITAVAQKETAKQVIVNRLREAGGTSAAMPASLDLDRDDARAALADLAAAGTVCEARTGLYYIDEETAKKAPRPGNGFVALLAVLVTLSVMASLIAVMTTR